MAIRINSNTTQLNLNKNLAEFSKSLKGNFNKLASGNRLSNSSTDPAALQIAEKLSAEISTGMRALMNVSDATSVLNIAEGALSTALDITIRIEELSTQAANGAISQGQVSALSNEIQALKTELNTIQARTTFNGQEVFGKSTTFQIGTNSSSNSQLTVSLNSVSTSSLGISDVPIQNQSDAQALMNQAKQARASISSELSNVGASQSRLQTAYENLQTSRQNNIEARSRIADADIATEAAFMAKNKIMQNANVSLMAFNSTNLSNVLKLLKA